MVISVTLGALVQESVAREDRFAVSAAAAPHYNREVPGKPGQLREESYVFLKGRFFGDAARNESLENLSFDAVARTLAVDLARQGYKPAPEAANADLLLMVHWGITQIQEPIEDSVLAMDRLNAAVSDVASSVEANGLADTGALNEQLANQRLNGNLQLRSMQANARLLGYNVALAESSKGIFQSPEEQTLRSELAEERYFVIVMAYDYRALREQKMKEVLWITRISVRGPGNNFVEALPALSRVGGDFFGLRQTELQRVRTTIGPDDRRRGITEIGELQRVEEATPPASPEK